MAARPHARLHVLVKLAEAAAGGDQAHQLLWVNRAAVRVHVCRVGQTRLLPRGPAAGGGGGRCGRLASNTRRHAGHQQQQVVWRHPRCCQRGAAVW